MTARKYLDLGAGHDLGPVDPELREVLRAVRQDTVEVHCPGRHSQPGGPVLGLVSAGPAGAVVIVVRHQADPFLLSDLARLARRQWPERNPKAKPALYGATWLLDEAPKVLDFHCHRCSFRGWLGRSDLQDAHLKPGRTVITPAPVRR